jgi:hypothetical protein
MPCNHRSHALLESRTFPFDARPALRIAPRCVVMGRGQVVFAGKPAEFKADAGVRKAWLDGWRRHAGASLAA